MASIALIASAKADDEELNRDFPNMREALIALGEWAKNNELEHVRIVLAERDKHPEGKLGLIGMVCEDMGLVRGLQDLLGRAQAHGAGVQ